MPIAPQKTFNDRLPKAKKKKGKISFPIAKPKQPPLKSAEVFNEITAIKSCLHALVNRLDKLSWDLESRGAKGCQRVFDPDDDIPF